MIPKAKTIKSKMSATPTTPAAATTAATASTSTSTAAISRADVTDQTKPGGSFAGCPVFFVRWRPLVFRQSILSAGRHKFGHSQSAGYNRVFSGGIGLQTDGVNG